jgi:CheY-like chemotaxis protein
MKDPNEKLEILVVDDEADSREALAELLLNESYAVVCAENGRRALDCLTGMTPALIILDLMMPVMSGWEFLAQQKRDAKVRSVPIVVVTGSGLVRDVEAEAVVHKPIDFRSLMKVVKENCLQP